MNPRRHLFTSESVSEGHPDKIADQISDAILDAFLAEEPEAKVACETFVADNLVVIAGEFKTVRKELFNEIQGRAEAIARQVLRDIGYRDTETGIDPNTCEVQVRFNHQSIQIHKGITLAGGDIGAGDQGLMFGYACDETPDLMPYPVWLAHRLVQKQAELRKSGALPWLRPDAKSQVTVAYEGQQVAGIENVVISTQIERDLDPAWVTQEITREIIDPLVPVALRTPTFKLWVNPAGPFEIGGPNGDTGLTGRKILGNNGATLKKFGKLIAALIAEEGVNEKMAEFINPLAYLADQMTKFTTELGFKGFQNPDEVGAAAVDYMRVAGHLVFGYFWARMAQVALQEIAVGNTDKFYVAKLQTARFYFAKLFPETATLMRCARSGAKSLMETDEALA